MDNLDDWSNTPSLGIIGTAGRGTDGDKLNIGYWKLMLLIAQNVITVTGVGTLVSGGAAWADHLATSIFLHESNLQYKLFLPCGFEAANFIGDETARISNYYHNLFSEKVGRDSREEIDKVIFDDHCQISTGGKGGFKGRNTDIVLYRMFLSEH